LKESLIKFTFSHASLNKISTTSGFHEVELKLMATLNGVKAPFSLIQLTSVGFAKCEVKIVNAPLKFARAQHK
jgi:hypothetical protein